MWLILILLPKTAIGMCEVIDTWSTQPLKGQESDLWDIMSAVRGPDQNDDYNSTIKRGSTGVIRSKAFPNLSKFVGVVINTADKDINLQSTQPCGDHFKYHILAAGTALNISFKPKD